MATVAKTTETVMVMKATEETQDVYVLRLSKEEASALRAVLGSIAGNPARSRRKYTDSVLSAFIGVVPGNYEFMTGSLEFRDGGLA